VSDESNVKRPVMWKCAYLQDTNKKIIVATDGSVLRVRYATNDTCMKPIEIDLVECNSGKEINTAEMKHDVIFIEPEIKVPKRKMNFWELIHWWVST